MIIDVTELNLGELNFTKEYDIMRMKRAKSIYCEDGVDITKVEKISEKYIKIYAKVKGSSWEKYHVELDIENETITHCKCTCEDYRNGFICKHIIATSMETLDPHSPNTEALKIEAERKKREYQIKYSNALSTISRFKQEKELNFDNVETNQNISIKSLYEQVKLESKMQKEYLPELVTQLKLEPKIDIGREQDLNVSFKIGQTKMYVLKDVKEFYESFLKEETIQYGRNLRFIAKKESFTEESQELLKFILDYGQILKYNEKIRTTHYYYYASMHISGKNLYVMDDKIDTFFDIVKKIPISASGYGLSSEEYKCTDKELKIRLNLTKKENEYVININLENYNYVESPKNIYIFYRNGIYKFDRDRHLEMILEMFRFNKHILVPEDKIEEFKKYVMSDIMDFVETESLPAEVAKEAILVNKLASKIYLDLDEKDNITMELKFCYADYEFNILDNNYKQYVLENNIVRNMIEERNVLKRICLDGFELVGDKTYFVLKNQDDIYEFLSEKVLKYMNDFEVLVTDKFKNKKIKNPKISNVSVKLDNGLLELDMSKINVDIDEVKDILKSYNIKKKYYKLKNGDYLNLEKNEDIEFLNDVQNILDVNYDKLENGIIKIPANRSMYLEKMLHQNRTINTTRNDDFTRLINNIENKNFSENIKISKKFEGILRDYQKTGYKWLKVLENYKLGGILADDMGLGKTLQVIALISSELKTKNIKPSIVVCPSSLVLNWKAEAEKWAKDMKVLAIKGDLATRKNLIESYKNYDLIITSYDSLKRDVLEYEDKEFKYIIADEAQYIKNFTTQNATALKNLIGETKFALTGTPIENSISELWSIFDFIMPGYLYNYNKFKKKFEIPILKDNDEQALQKLKLMINPFILRRVKTDVLTELPEKNITVMNSEMVEEQRKLYVSYFAQTKKEVAEQLSENGFEKSKFKILMLLTRLRQICCHPSLFIDNYNGESGKLNQCMDIVKEAIQSEHRILLFSTYTSMFSIIEEKLKKEDIKYYKLTGSTQVSKRVEMVEKFNKDESIKVFLISLKAGGTGLNLTGADVVIHYDPWWNVSSENQATDRAYRIGQKNSVQVYKLITTNTIEEKINKLQEKKAELSKQILSTEEKFINQLSKEDIIKLFE